MKNYRNYDLLSTVFPIVIGIAFIVIGFVGISISNPKIEKQCMEKGGQVLERPLQLNSCLYPAKK